MATEGVRNRAQRGGRRATLDGLAVNFQADGSIWGSTAFTCPGHLTRLELGSNPPLKALGEVHQVPLHGFGVRGADIDRSGVDAVSAPSLMEGRMGTKPLLVHFEVRPDPLAK